MTQTAPETPAATERPRIPSDSTFGARLALVRQMMGWGNVAEAAKECGLPVDSWRHWERDNMEPRRLVTIALAIATRANVDIDWLVYGPVKPGRQLSVEYPAKRDPLAARIVKPVVANGEPAHGDFRRRRPKEGLAYSDTQRQRQRRTVSSANHTAPITRGSVA